MKKRGVMLIIVLLLVLPLIQAANYGSGTYGTGKFGIGQVAAAADEGDVISGPSSRGGGSAGGGKPFRRPPFEEEIDYECYTDSDCGEDQYCFEYNCYNADCHDNSECTGYEVCWNLRCVKLFDIEIVDFQSPIKLGEFFEFSYFLKGMADINDDVVVRFYIEKDGAPISTGSDTFYMSSFEEKTKSTKLFLPSDITSGIYDFRVQIIYGAYSAESHRTIEIEVSEGMAKIGGIEAIKPIKSLSINIISVMIGLAAFILALVFYIERRKIKRGIIAEGLWIKKHKISLLVFLLFVVLGILAYFLDWLRFIPALILDAGLWYKKSFLPILKTVLAFAARYSSPSSPYFYYVLGSLFILTVLIVLVIMLKKKTSVRKPDSFVREKREENKDKLISVKVKAPKNKVEPSQKEIPVKKIKKRKLNLRKLFGRHKFLYLIILSALVLAAVAAYLFYSKVLTLGQLQDLGHAAVKSINNTIEKSIPVIKNIWSAAVPYLSLTNPYFYYLISSIAGLVLIITFLIVIKKTSLIDKIKGLKIRKKKKTIEAQPIVKKERREIKVFELLRKFVMEHHILSIVILWIVVLVCIVAYLFYVKIFSLALLFNFLGSAWQSLSNVFSSLLNWPLELWDWVAGLVS